jgi:N,N'-diacetyllegionaminate synthase
MRPRTLSVSTRQIGEGQPCFVLAEVASAHSGSADNALKMLDAAFKMGADGIKFQLFRADHLVVRRHPQRKDFDAIELPEKDWHRILRAAKASGLALFCEAFDPP